MRLLRSLTCSLLCLSIAAPLAAEWKRTVQSGKGESIDTSTAHSFDYFTQNPFLRDDGASLCTLCTAEDKAGSALNHKANVDVRHIGIISGLPILEVDYAFTNKNDDFTLRWISILVETAPQAYNEIYHLQADGGIALPIEPSRIVHVPGGDILMINNSDGGNGGGCYEGYWRITASGNTQVDFSPLQKAITDHLPANTIFISSCWALHLDKQLIKSGVQKIDAKCHACDWMGEVTAHFHLEGNRAEATDVTFKPNL
ncbi:MAG TPA: hypothetical protein VK578_24930 [Edaphobacter sp.]|nr:hypothetical protein [Edaphobacter sp.]